MLKNKRFLLGLTEKLTEGNLESMNQYKINPESDHRFPEGQDHETAMEMPTEDTISKERIGWNKFTEVFMVSALNGEGVGDIKVDLLLPKI